MVKASQLNVLNMDFSDFKISREEVAVVVSGIVSMGLEILAGRVIAPEFGSTIYTWGSIIGVSMLALSLGYHYGGQKSSRIRGMRDLERFLVLTSGYILLVMFSGETILGLTASLPIPSIYAPIVPVALLFGPPTYFLGYISPYAAQLSSKNTKGEASGHFYAIGTAGSIIGAFGTTFILVPSFSVNQIYLFFATLSALPLFKDLKNPNSYFFLAVLLLGLLLMDAPVSAQDTIHREQTAYQELRVDRDGNLTTLYLDGHPQSAKYLNSTGTPWDYPDYFYMPYLMREDVENALFIGGGGFVGPQQFAERGVKVDAVELDPRVVSAAENYFNLSESENLSVHTMDGREFLEETNQTYDVIVLDAYRKANVPFHLTTREFFRLAHEKTDREGVIVSNVISTASGPGSRFGKSYYKTLGQEFRSTYYFPTSDTAYAQNIEIIASKQPGLTEKQLLERNREYSEKNLSEEIRKLQEVDTEDAQILTDDYAPVEKLLNPLIGRKYVVS
jgi:spermidine synthase